jgi:hypothetical protein
MADCIPPSLTTADTATATAGAAEVHREHPAADRPAALEAPAAARSPGDRLLIGFRVLAHLTSLSVRHLRRLDSSRDIPGRVTSGTRVLFQTEEIREWVRAGLPDREHWAALQKRTGKH